MKEIGRRLRLYRLKNNLLEKQMVSLLGISREYYSAIEQGKRFPGHNLLKRIADFTGMTIVSIYPADNPLISEMIRETNAKSFEIYLKENKKKGNLNLQY